jgi:MFS family permease
MLRFHTKLRSKMISIGPLLKKIDITQTAPGILLLLNSFVWYILTSVIFRAAVNKLDLLEIEKLALLTSFFVSIAVSAFAGSKLFPKMRTKQLYIWPFIGTLATVLLTMLSSSNIAVNFVLSVFLGFSIGSGLPSCLSHFASKTTHENRGLVAGITWGGVGFIVLGLAFLTNPLSQVELIVILAAWRLLGGVGFLAINLNHTQQVTQSSPSYSEVIHKREILFYLVPWIMFMLINFAEVPILENAFNSIFGQNFFSFLQLAEFAFIGLFALVGGIISDFIGRKKVVIAGFIILGVEYATITLFSTNAVTAYLFLVLDGTTWGLLFSVFLTVLWGDLSENREKEKYYTLGGLPYILANVVSLLIRPYASGIGTGTAFSFASFFLFIAVIPLMYATESLPEKVMKDRDLKSYVDKAMKKVLKEAGKENQNENESPKNDNKNDNNNNNPEEEKTEKEYEEAERLAEKYY